MIIDLTYSATKTALTVVPGSFDNSPRTTTQPARDKTFYCRVYPEKAHMLMPCPQVKEPGELLQKQKEH